MAYSISMGEQRFMERRGVCGGVDVTAAGASGRLLCVNIPAVNRSPTHEIETSKVNVAMHAMV